MSTERKTETITIGGNVPYAKVAARSAEFHRDNERCSIVTTCKFTEGYAIFSATVTTKKGEFTGHSMDKVAGKQKQFEKQETIAVGRALAFAGYLASGDIACAEEMADVITGRQLNSLKQKFATTREDELSGLDRPQKQDKFNAWCLSIIGEQSDYTDPRNWEPAWFKTCWRELIGPDADIPFEE